MALTTRRMRFNRRRPVNPRAARARARYVRRGMQRSRLGTRVAQPVQFFKRSTYQTNWIVNDTITNSFKDLTFTLADVPNHTEFTSLYDQYKLSKVVFTLIPKFNSNEPFTGIVPPTWSILDYDGAFPNTPTAMLQYTNLHMVPGQKWHKRVLVPKFPNSVYKSSVTSGYQPNTGFLDCNDDTVPHYGATVMLMPTGVEGPFAYDLKVTYYLSFKNVR